MKTILIVEDEELLAGMYQEKFQDEGFSVVSVKTIEEARSAMATKKPDIILLDILLHDENGLDLLKGTGVAQEIPVIVFSNFDDTETVKVAKELGAKEYLIKTDYTPSEIMEKLRAYAS